MTECFTLDLFLDYIRMVSYAIVILTSLRGIMYRKFGNLLFLGDAVMSVALLLTLIFSNLLKASLSESADFFITVPAILWAFIHFKAMLQNNHKLDIK